MTKPILYLHIGHGKTASSSIQKWLDINSDKLLKKGILIPKVGHDSSMVLHHSLGHIFFHNNNKRFPIDFSREELVVEIEKEITQSRNRVHSVIISSEDLAYGGSDVYQPFINLFSCVKPIMYFRRLDKFAPSEINQMLRNGSGPENIFKYASVSLNKMIMASNHQKIFFSGLKFYSNLSGADNVILRPFEKNQFCNKDVIQDFCKITNIEYGSKYSPVAAEVNTTDSYDVMELRRLGILAGVPNKFINEMVSAFNLKGYNKRDQSDEILITSTQKRELIARMQPIYDEMSESFLKQKNAELFHDSLPDLSDTRKVYDGIEPSVLCNFLTEFSDSLGDRLNKEQKFVSMLRDTAIKFEAADLKISVKLMKHALLGRPDEVDIQEKLTEYETLLDIQEKTSFESKSADEFVVLQQAVSNRDKTLLDREMTIQKQNLLLMNQKQDLEKCKREVSRLRELLDLQQSDVELNNV